LRPSHDRSTPEIGPAVVRARCPGWLGEGRGPRAAGDSARDRPPLGGAQGDGGQRDLADDQVLVRSGFSVLPAGRKERLGVMGPVPPRVDERVKTGLLELVDHVVEEGWRTTRACTVLDRSTTTTTNMITGQ
jgi:hypothetical protein